MRWVFYFTSRPHIRLFPRRMLTQPINQKVTPRGLCLCFYCIPNSASHLKHTEHLEPSRQRLSEKKIHSTKQHRRLSIGTMADLKQCAFACKALKGNGACAFPKTDNKPIASQNVAAACANASEFSSATLLDSVFCLETEIDG